MGVMLTVLRGFAEFERALIIGRTNEGRVRALAKGVRFGRTPKLTDHQAREVLRRVEVGEATREIDALDDRAAQGAPSSGNRFRLIRGDAH